MRWISKVLAGFLSLIIIYSNLPVINELEASSIIRPPRDVKVETIPEGAKISWNYNQPDTTLKFNNGQPGGIWQLVGTAGLGVIYDLSAFPNATLEEIDFVHYSNQSMRGPYYYRIHIYDMENQIEIAMIDSLVANDAFSNPEYETYVDLGSIPAVNSVGIFIQALSTVDSLDYSYPSVITDYSTYIPGVNFLCIDFADPFNSTDPDFTNIYELNLIDRRSSNVILNLWINKSDGQKIIPHKSPAKFNSQPLISDLSGIEFIPFTDFKNHSLFAVKASGFSVFRGTNLGDFNKIATMDNNTFEYLDQEAPIDSLYLYAVVTHVDTNSSKYQTIQYSNPVVSISKARRSEINTYIPDHLGQLMDIRGFVNSINFSDKTAFFIQDRNSAIYLYSDFFSCDLSIGDSVYISGKIGQINGLTSIEPDSASQVYKISEGIKPDTLKGIFDINPEQVEGRLVFFENMSICNGSSWPSVGQSGIVQMTDGGDTLNIYLNDQTNLPGWEPSAGPYNLTGIIDQYSEKEIPDDGYQIRPRFIEDFMLLTTIDKESIISATRFKLAQNFPNPFNPSTTIQYSLPNHGVVNLRVYDITGSLVETLVNGYQNQGIHTIDWKPSDLASGVYFYKLVTKKNTAVKKMMYIR